MAYGRDFEPMVEIYCDSYMNLEFYAMSTCLPNVHCTLGKIILSQYKIHYQKGMAKVSIIIPNPKLD